MNNLKFKFNGSDQIQRNYSQAGQDLFVLAALNGKRNGIYIEVGAGPSVLHNNTLLLETEFNWKGVSIEINQAFYDDHKTSRTHHIELVDGTTVNYSDLLIRASIDTNIIDYVSLDLDPAPTLIALYNLPMDTHKFAVITYEHDSYACGTKYKELSTSYLTSKGYELVVSNVVAEGYGEFEDWWVHPELVDRSVIDSMKAVDNSPKLNYMLSNL
jgi:hypothetical protein